MTNINKQYHHSKSAIQLEEEQINKAKKNPKDFAVLYEKYYVQIFRYIFKRIADENESADLTSQVFVKALQSLHKYEFRGVPFSAWLHQIARNELNLCFRAQKYNRSVDVKTEQLHEVIEEFDPENNEEQPNEEKTQQLMASLRELNKDELELLEMRYFEKRPFQEVSEILNISVSNAKVKMHRIIKKLKGIMQVESV